MLFFVFLAIGAQNATAQYLNSDDATTALMTEMQSIVDNPIYAVGQEKDVQYPVLTNKLEVYNHVFELIKGGETVANAIGQGFELPASQKPTPNGLVSMTPPKIPVNTAIQQELVDLLTQ